MKGFVKKLTGDRGHIYFWERIGFRILVGFLLPLMGSAYALISISGVQGYYTGSIEEYSEKKDSIDQLWANVRVYELGYRVNLSELKFAIENYIREPSPSNVSVIRRLMEDFNRNLQQAYLISGDQGRSESLSVYRRIFSTVKFYREYIERLISDDVPTNKNELRNTRKRMLYLSEQIEKSLKRLKARYELFELKDQDRLRNEFGRLREDLVFMTMLILAFGLFLCFAVTYSITHPMKKIIVRLRDIAQGEGDLTRRVQTRTVGEMAEVSWWTNVFLDTTHEIVATIFHLSQTLQSSVKAVSKQNSNTTKYANDINRSMMTQSMSLEECSIALKRIDDLMKSSNESSRQASSLSRLAMDRALNGGASVHETVEAMQKIEESTHRIDSLVSTITSIANKTNLLAINAAIEASKAGEHGKGFAVVAEEVRKLADRSRRLTDEVNELITETNERVKLGGELATGAGVALDGIIKDVEAVTSLIQRIAEGSTKQTESSSQLVGSIQAITEAVRDNLRQMQEVNRSSEVSGFELEKLSTMVGQLHGLISQFKLRGESNAIFHHQAHGIQRMPAGFEPDEFSDLISISKLTAADGGSAGTPSMPTEPMQLDENGEKVEYAPEGEGQLSEDEEGFAGFNSEDSQNAESDVKGPGEGEDAA